MALLALVNLFANHPNKLPWSQKYNLVWDSILDLHIFPADLAVQEVAFYKTHLDPFGLPLDNSATYTKLDWTV